MANSSKPLILWPMPTHFHVQVNRTTFPFKVAIRLGTHSNGNKIAVSQVRPFSLQGIVRGTKQPHKLLQVGATPSPATTLEAQPVMTSPLNEGGTKAEAALPLRLTLNG